MKKIVTIPLFSFFLLLLFYGCRKNNSGVHPPCICPPDFGFTDGEPAWSPGGKWIAYVHGDSDIAKTGIYLITPDGKGNHLWFASRNAMSPNWSPAGKWLTFNLGTQIWKKKLNNDSLTQLTFEGRNFSPDWSPDGKWIVYRRSYSYPEMENIQGIWLMTFNGAHQKQLFSGNCGNPFWIEPNDIGFFRGSVNSSGDVIGDSLFSYFMDKNSIKRIKLVKGEVAYPNYSPVLDKIVFSFKTNHEKFQIYVMGTIDNNLKRLTNTQGYSCDWSPDGSKIVYTDSRGSNGRLWIMNADGSQKHQLTFPNSF